MMVYKRRCGDCRYEGYVAEFWVYGEAAAFAADLLSDTNVAKHPSYSPDK